MSNKLKKSALFVEVMRKVVFLFAMFSFAAFGQQGGKFSYQFLDLDFNARSMSMGGDYISIKDGDIDLAVGNPATINASMHNKLSLNHFIYPSGINYGQVAYGRTFEKAGTFVGHLRYVSYGKFDRMDEVGIQQGTFTAGDYAMGVGYGRELNKYFSIGANFNMIFSHYETYNSFGIAGDMAAVFHDDKSNITASLVARNFGYQLVGYTKKNHEPLPVEMLMAISYKFHHAPFRLSLIAKDITNWDLTYNDPTLVPTIDQLTGDTIPVPSASFVQKMAYHTNFGLEIVPKSDRFFIRLGFNFARRNGLGVENRKGAGGFSAGFGIKIKKFAFSYGVSFYSAAGVSNAFGITTNLSEWKSRKVVSTGAN